ncbi:unnamed protein product [Cladocopium goreaui]|uniref:Uncharacterized protein n=1 Tax=Cladocopium goreaui TaxID=2562237 RepID=A0A9P1M6F0_9DINO|nr:unnamed protein product [Cladocopium goreaui]
MANAMQVDVEALPGCEVPKGCVLGIRVGETLKQKRFDSTRTSCSFPKPDYKMSANIDIYQHVGSGSVDVDPSLSSTDQVSIGGWETTQSIRLKVTTQSAEGSAEEQHQRRQVEKQETKTLADCIAKLVKKQPDDPIEFLCQQLQDFKLKAGAESSGTGNS